MNRRGLVLIAAALMLALPGPALAQNAEQSVSVRVTAAETPRPTDTPKPTKSPKPTKTPMTNGGGGLGTTVLGNVAGNGGGGGPLPRTGRDIAVLAMIGSTLVAAGTGLIVVARRRRHA